MTMDTDLTRLLDQYDERRRVDLEREGKARDDDAQFLARFAALRREVVWPVFERVGTMLTERGHGVEIDEQEFAAEAGGKPLEAEISLRIAPAGMPPQLHAGDHERTLTITTRHYNKTVWINAGRSLEAGGIAGAKGAYSIERIDKALVEDTVLKFVGSVMAPG